MCLQTDIIEEIDETENRKTIEKINETRSRTLSKMMKLINIQPDRSGQKETEFFLPEIPSLSNSVMRNPTHFLSFH